MGIGVGKKILMSLGTSLKPINFVSGQSGRTLGDFPMYKMLSVNVTK